ncbi:MAG: type II toxin-antitoxin system RelE/ParE family toxin [Candidatus Thermoplasmatota archaeon]|nr:type II toxin-antitoxin system RelE/ParE family toxin [Candidatus Thermoplasmatota archaeon]
MTFEVILTLESESFIKKCDKVLRERLIKSLRKLKADPQNGKPLTSLLTGLWSPRMGYYRAIYQIMNNELVVLVIKIEHRKKVYD